MLQTDRRLQTMIGKKTWFTQYRSIAFPEVIIELFLLKLIKLNICSHITGSFTAYSAGMFNSYRAFTLYLVLTDENFANIFIQRGSLLSDVFYMDDFRFQLRKNQPDLADIISYTLTKDDFSVKLVVIGIDSTTPCGPSSNADFTYFIWDNFEPFSFKKHSVAPLPSEDGSDRTMSYLQSHRAKSDGWRDNVLCGSCKIHFIGIIHFVAYNLPEKCSCNICISQPPSLVASATQVVFNHTFNLEKF